MKRGKLSESRIRYETDIIRDFAEAYLDGDPELVSKRYNICYYAEFLDSTLAAMFYVIESAYEHTPAVPRNKDGSPNLNSHEYIESVHMETTVHAIYQILGYDKPVDVLSKAFDEVEPYLCTLTRDEVDEKLEKFFADSVL